MRPRIVAALLVILTLSACEPGTTGTTDVAAVVPNVVGMDYADAKATLEQAGFVVNKREKAGDGTPGTVQRQMPDANSVQWPVGTVTIFVLVPSHSSPPPPALPQSNTADGCVDGTTMWRHRFSVLLTSGSATTAAEKEANSEELRKIIYFTQLGGGAMLIEDDERGPVRNGDACLASSAALLSLISSVLPHGPLQDQVLNRATRFYREVLSEYPSSPYADDARQFLGP
jgi:hypothetical protein